MIETLQVLDASPASLVVGANELAAAIDACLTCVQACTVCADSDLVEEDIGTLRTCIALNQVCADICDTTARVLSRPAQGDNLTVRLLLETCVRACTVCEQECALHAAHHRHCAVCAEACRECIQACTVLLNTEVFQATRPSSDA